MPRYIPTPEPIKNTILKQVKEDGRSVVEAGREFGISPKTIYTWLRKEVDETGVNASAYLTKIHRLEKEKEDLVQIIGALSIVVERAKKKDADESRSKRSPSRS